MTQDLFGEVPPGAPSTPARGPKGGKHYTAPAGYAALPGGGPRGETCRTCKHKADSGNRTARRVIKCDLMRTYWTHGPKTDILARSPACRRWESR